MAGLTSLTTCNGYMKFGPQLMNLTVLRQLKSVGLGSVLSVDIATTMYFAQVIAAHTKCRPDIDLCLCSQVELTDYLAHMMR